MISEDDVRECQTLCETYQDALDSNDFLCSSMGNTAIKFIQRVASGVYSQNVGVSNTPSDDHKLHLKNAALKNKTSKNSELGTV
ncbi:hypothetical protein [Methanolapillus millepedarum]|uniref:Uncharacterized protein n=1 Tax=Methanolapillus millepedarum TaxID=3028296 RepID=A0AA96V2A7_9EURY|nr:hypothetical protein MsAc7_07090 [Methanosarcinaceae archaeon Ac7]